MQLPSNNACRCRPRPRGASTGNLVSPHSVVEFCITVEGSGWTASSLSQQQWVSSCVFASVLTLLVIGCVSCTFYAILTVMAHRHIIQCVLFVRWFFVIVQLQTQVTVYLTIASAKKHLTLLVPARLATATFPFTCQRTTNIVPVAFLPSSMTKQSKFRRCSFQFARTCKPDLAGSEDFERHESRHTKPQLVLLVFHAWSRRGRVGFRPTYIFGLRSWPFVLGVRGWFHVVVIGIVMLEIDIFASSTASSTSSLSLNQGLCTTLGYVAFTEFESMIGDAMRIQNTVFDVNFVASEVVFQPLHSDTATSLHGESVNAVRVSRYSSRTR